MKKLLTILVLIMLIISFFQITSMYALYKEQLYGDYTTLLGAWEIKVNTKDITSSGQIEKFTISDDQLGYVESEYIQVGKFAPGGQVYYDMIIDPSNTDVSIVYQIEILSNMSADTPATIQLISATDYFQKEGETEQIENEVTYQYQEGNTYTSVIPVTRILDGYKNYVRLYFKWVNDDNNNETDTVLGETSNATISIPVKINLKQYTGEVIGNGS